MPLGYQDSDEEWLENLGYRGAYGIASRMLEGQHRSMATGRYCGRDSERNAILDEVASQLDAVGSEEWLVAGVDDAIAGRKPRC